MQGMNPNVDAALTQFKESIRRISDETEDKGDINLRTASELNTGWKRVEERFWGLEGVED